MASSSFPSQLHENLFPLFSQLKHIFSRLTKPCPSIYYYDDHEQNNPHNSASLPTVPVYIFAESVKEKLPSMPYNNFLERISRGKVLEDNIIKDSYSSICIVCLSQIEQSHEVRVPFNCCHVFHRECLDAWVDQGHVTCPLCRSKLLPTQDHGDLDHDHQEDPWRSERMIYLFGDDCLFGQH